MTVAAWHRIPPFFAAAARAVDVPYDGRSVMKPLDLWGAMACSVLIFAVLLLPRAVTAQPAAATYQIFMSAVEIKGSTTAEQLAPPTVNPTDLSKGYGFKPPGEAAQGAPQRWEVSSYLFTPGFATVQQGDG